MHMLDLMPRIRKIQLLAPHLSPRRNGPGILAPAGGRLDGAHQAILKRVQPIDRPPDPPW